MRILVIGGTQFMGREVVRRLVARGHDMSVLHRRDHHDLGAGVGNLQADRSDLRAVRRVLADHAFDAVVDLAYDWQKGTPADQVEAAARAAGERVRRYVFMSSIAAYGFGLDRRESDPLAPPEVPVPYVQHKAQAERALFRLHAETGLPAVTVRPPFVYGPRQPFYREQFFWDRLRDGRPVILPDGGDTPMQWAFVDDVAEVCVRALEVPEAAGEAFNIGHPPISQRDFVLALARVAGVEPTLVPVPRDQIMAQGGHLFAGHLYFGEYLDLPPITEVVEKAPRMLGVAPVDFGEGLRRGFEWYLAQPRRVADYAFEDRVLGRS
ncbi:MAG: NAD-dependent epimerase/dehydratase family protein [Vicinamibacterales bacterium]|jgi:nucleoside-diphosphate-sugar epimerase|nr:NAD-dependent epimerase/dehydratase family protein [Vicinamibacterales bacterium]